LSPAPAPVSTDRVGGSTACGWPRAHLFGDRSTSVGTYNVSCEVGSTDLKPTGVKKNFQKRLVSPLEYKNPFFFLEEVMPIIYSYPMKLSPIYYRHGILWISQFLPTKLIEFACYLWVLEKS
jgi:hypothetical protein